MGEATTESDLNLPEEWAFPSPAGVCPPVHISGEDHSCKATKRKAGGKSTAGSSEQMASTLPSNKKRRYAQDDSREADATAAPAPTDDGPRESSTKASENGHVLAEDRSGGEGDPMECSPPKDTSNRGSTPEIEPEPSPIDEASDKPPQPPSPPHQPQPPRADGSDNGDKSKTDCGSGRSSDVGGREGSLPKPKQVATSSPAPAKPEKDGDGDGWSCGRCGAANVVGKSRCSSCQGWKGGRRDDLSKPKKANAASTIERKTSTSEHSVSPTKAVALVDLTDIETSNFVDSSVEQEGAASVEAPTPKLVSTPQSHSAVTEKESKYPVWLPANWTVREVPRPKGNHVDRYYYSPNMGHKFRSKKEVERFLNSLEETGGDETADIAKFQEEDTATSSLSNLLAVQPAAESHSSPGSIARVPGQVGAPVTSATSFPAHSNIENTALGHSRSSTKDIRHLIDLTGPETSMANDSSDTQNAASPVKKRAQKSAAKSLRHPTVTDKESKYPALPAKGYPPGWSVREIPRSKGSHVDRYFYSPNMGYRFRSKKEVERFLKCLQETDGDESAAIAVFHNLDPALETHSSPGTRSTSKPSTTQQEPEEKPFANKAKVVEYISPPPKSPKNKNGQKVKETRKEDTESVPAPSSYVKPAIRKGEKVYACWTDDDGQRKDWFPGRVWDVKECDVGEYGPIRRYDVIFDDGDKETGLGEIWVTRKSEYELCVKKPEAEWKGVTNVTFSESKDEYARVIGWYQVDGAQQVYSSLREALKAHDAHIIKTKGKIASELNFPEEHGVI